MMTSDRGRLKRWLGRHPLRALLRIAAALFGAGVSGWLLTSLWPEPDRVALGALPTPEDQSSLAMYPDTPVTVLVIGVDADDLNDPSNQAAPNGMANADALMLVRIDASQPLEVLQLPIELAVQLPGRDGPISLGSVWRAGGVALVADAVSEIVGLPDAFLQRYVVLTRKALRTAVDGIGEVDVILSESYQYTDNQQEYSVNLQAGRQSLNGAQAEQLVRYRNGPRDDASRRIRQRILMRSVVEQIQAPSGIVGMRSLLQDLSGQLDTNLSSREMLSLAAALIASPPPVRFQQLPLSPRAGQQTLRQLKPDLKLPLWPTTP